jgi:hypothetical protein
MGQEWKTLSLVVIGAAIVGWLAVRQLSGISGRGVAKPIAAAPVGARPTEAAAPAEPEEEVAAPAVPARTAHAPAANAAGETDGDPAYIERDLEVLAQALGNDQRIEDRVMPRVNDVLDVPGVVPYRRAPDFWEPALDGSRGANR